MSIELVATRTTISTQQTYTFNDVPLGAAAADRYIIVSARGWRGNNTLTVTAITVAGEATSEIVQAANGPTCCAIRRTNAAVAAGAAGTITVEFSNPSGSAACHIDVYRASGLADLAAHDTDTDVNTSGLSASAMLDVPPRGVVIAAAFAFQGTGNLKRGGGASRAIPGGQAGHSVSALMASGDISWDGADEDSDENMAVAAAVSNRLLLAAASFAVDVAADGTAAGAASAAAQGRGEARAAGAAAGTSIAAAAGRGEWRAAGAAEAAAAALAAARGEARAAGASAGASIAAAAGFVPAGLAAGAAEVSGVARSMARAAGSGSGTGAGAANGGAQSRAAALSAGVAVAASPGRSLAAAAGTASGGASASGFPPPAGAAAGTSIAAAAGRGEWRARAQGTGVAAAAGTGQTLRRFFVIADPAGRFRLDLDIPPGVYVARARGSAGGPPAGWSGDVFLEIES